MNRHQRNCILFLVLLVGCILPFGARPVAAASISVVGDDGVRISLAHPPHRLIALAPSVTEVLYALGLGPRMVAVDKNSDYPKAVGVLPRVADYYGGPNYEKILQLKPDLIVAAAGITPQAGLIKLRGLHLAVLVTNPTTIAGILRSITLVGTATGVPVTAARVTAGLQARIDRVKQALQGIVSRPRVYYEIDTTLYTAGHGSFIDSLISLAGGTNIAAQIHNPYPQLSAEKIIAADPQVILLGDTKFGGSVARVDARPGWSAITAVRMHHVYAFDDDLASRPGPRIVDGLEAMARMLHPAAFK